MNTRCIKGSQKNKACPQQRVKKIFLLYNFCIIQPLPQKNSKTYFIQIIYGECREYITYPPSLRIPFLYFVLLVFASIL